MKTFKYIILHIVMLVYGSMHAQTINWANLDPEERHIFGANIGLDFGTVYGAGYGYHVKSNLVPFTVNIEFSTPVGEEFLDDFKSKAGVKIEWIDIHHFKFTTDLLGVFRRYENKIVRLLDFGCDLSGGIGYYRNRWFVSGEIGFDKAIITHFKHSRAGVLICLYGMKLDRVIVGRLLYPQTIFEI